MDKLENIWHGQLTADSFGKLKSLFITECRNLVTVFPWNVLERFQRLELYLGRCDSVQEIYQLEGFNVEANVVAAFELRDLSVCSLESLKHVWSKDPQGVFTFQSLISIRVYGCEVLKNLFPTSMAEGLLQLEQLQIENHCGVEEIVAKAEGVELAPYFFKFPQPTFLELSNLPDLRSFYPGTYTCEWQKLRRLDIYDCPKVMKFAYQQLDSKDQKHPNSTTFLFVGKVSPNLEELTLESENLTATQLGQLPFDCFSKLKVLTLRALRNESRPFLLCFLERLCYLEEVIVCSGSLEELFSHGGFVGEEERAKTLARVKTLHLTAVHNLKHIWKQDSQVEPFFNIFRL
ncbi:hypothetical protein GH714_004036 [Hevea brasiliensis]|uniref:Disease resistance protein At4g27190-like leucine-rich repeats domain-containing protein n=1 Tax=Hevea brasiliensis TaxID=3981 RepID=A0A6A6KGY3_HEVBR|nr:hypothetical protein GH714_004036 [Hevea brasiliensis]